MFWILKWREKCSMLCQMPICRWELEILYACSRICKMLTENSAWYVDIVPISPTSIPRYILFHIIVSIHLCNCLSLTLTFFLFVCVSASVFILLHLDINCACFVQSTTCGCMIFSEMKTSPVGLLYLIACSVFFLPLNEGEKG